jgi:hypothetical protein
VDLEAVARERERIAMVVAGYSLKDRLNADESGLFGL